MKKGQMTVFIIIGILMLLFAVVVLFLAAKRAPPVEVGLDAAANSVSAYVSDCLSVEAKPLLKQLALHGGLLAPKSGVYYNKTELTTYCTSSEDGCVSELITRTIIEAEINAALKSRVMGCLVDFAEFSKRGVRVESGTLAVRSTVRDDDVILHADFPLTIILGNRSVTRTAFTATVVSNLGLLHAATVDIANQDVSGFLDKTAWATSRQDFVVEKHKPYPNTLYRIELKKQDEIDVFQFALRGKETVGRAPFVEKPGLGCCTVDGLCFKNAPEDRCTGIYTSDSSCTCAPNVDEDVTGCCIDAFGDCEPTTHEQCRGKFRFGDKKCETASCNNLACDSTFNYATNSFTGPTRHHGESWCVFDSMAGRGLDYIGSRHYVHTCINGQEIVEECRDYREELCTESHEQASDGTSRSTAACRTNRWWDCAAQNDEQSCLDRAKRDCHWLGFLQYEQKKCVPYVKPGFKFWEGQGSGECAMGNQNKDLFGWAFPRTWGYATFLYCQRLGDCGNYRNIADSITRFGYHNPDGKEEDWVYYAAGWTKRGTEFLIDLGLQRDVINAAMPSGPGGGYARCRPWQAPPGGEDCKLCGSKGFKPCTLYQCKSLGRQCVYTEVMDVGKCSAAPSDIGRPEVELVNVTGRTFTRAYDPTLGAVVYSVSPGVDAYEPVNISIRASVESQCRLTPIPPNIDLDSLFGSDLALASYIPDLLLSNGEFRTDHTMQAVFPPFTDTHPLFIQCANQAGLENPQPIGLNLNVASAEPDSQPPIIIAAMPEVLRKDVAEDVTLWINEPFSQCTAQGATEPDLKCAANITHLSLDPAGPLGSFPCRTVIQATSDKVSVACTDIAGNMMVPFELNVTG